MYSLIISPNIGIHEFLDPLLKADQMSYVYANRLSSISFMMSNMTLRAHVNVSSDIYSQSHGLLVNGHNVVIKCNGPRALNYDFNKSNRTLGTLYCSN